MPKTIEPQKGARMPKNQMTTAQRKHAQICLKLKHVEDQIRDLELLTNKEHP
jgi:hypothetical protein